jgi:hypothetical protein
VQVQSPLNGLQLAPFKHGQSLPQSSPHLPCGQAEKAEDKNEYCILFLGCRQIYGTSCGHRLCPERRRFESYDEKQRLSTVGGCGISVVGKCKCKQLLQNSLNNNYYDKPFSAVPTLLAE